MDKVLNRGSGCHAVPDDDINTGGDFYLEDEMEEDGSGGYYSDDEDSDWISSFSSYNSEPGSGDDNVDIVLGSLHLNKEFIPEYYDPDTLAYQQLKQTFNLALMDTFESSPLRDSYRSASVMNFSPGSVKVDFEVTMIVTSTFDGNKDLLEESVKTVLQGGMTAGKFDDLSANASSLVVKARDLEPTMTTTTENNNIPDAMEETTEKNNNNINPYNPYNPYRPDGEVDKEEKNIVDLILGDPIIIAAIVGGIIVILLSVILLFLFVVYRLKKKDEGSYSLDEPAKSKDPTAYWKETKEFYA
ncbi:syndecan precursor [Apostichopus japonicus]|uniref:Syndecan n=1 Tax=Stichopus japonicus TaxID=307972 RepID=A0A2G8KZG5_STIJA|nr:syndecan precursor [Apostichopus japonicus]